MKYIDITQVYEEGMKKYPTSEDFGFHWKRHYGKGNDMALSELTLPTHLGTHLDSPFHMVIDGSCMEELPIERFIGRVQVIELRGRDFITKEALKTKNLCCERLIIKTDNTTRILNDQGEENVYFTPEACEYLVEKGIKLLGFDYFNVDKRGDKNRTAHRILLGSGMAILEGIFLQEVEEGEYLLLCLPLRIKEAEGSPCRAILLDKEEITKSL